MPFVNKTDHGKISNYSKRQKKDALVKRYAEKRKALKAAGDYAL